MRPQQYNNEVKALNKLRLDYGLQKDKSSVRAVRILSRITEKYVLLQKGKAAMLRDNPKIRFQGDPEPNPDLTKEHWGSPHVRNVQDDNPENIIELK